MKYIKNIFFLSILLLFSAPRSVYSMGNFDFDQIQNLQQELEEANKVIEDYISSLPADEQAEFNRAVDELSQMFESMSEEEFASFLNEMFTEEPMMMQPAEPFTPTPTAAPVEKAILTPEQQKKVENVIKIINDVIRQANIFLVQMSSSLQATKNVDSWAKKGSIMYWQPNADWQTLKIDIEKFIQQLYKLEDKDLDTQEYKYILDLIADEAAFNNLIQLQTNLNSSVPQIEISELDIKELSEQAKTAIKDTVQYFTESLYMLQLPKAFDAIFEKFEPKATKSRESQEAAEKKATEAAKRQRMPIGASATGMSAETSYGGYDSGYGGYDYGGYGDYGSSYGYPSDFYGGGGYGGGFGGGYGEEGFGGKEGKKGGSGGGGMGGGGGAGAPSGETAAKEEKPGLTPPVSGPVPKSPRLKKLVADIGTGMEDVAKIITDNTIFSTISTHIIGAEDTDPVNTDFANNIVQMNDKLKALKEEVVLLQSQMLKTPQATQAYYNSKLEPTIETSLATIINFRQNLESLEKLGFSKMKISEQKRWAYLAADDKILQRVKTDETNAPEKIQDLRKAVTTRISLTELLDTIKTFESALKTLKEKTAQEPAKPIQPTPTPAPLTPAQPAA